MFQPCFTWWQLEQQPEERAGVESQQQRPDDRGRRRDARRRGGLGGLGGLSNSDELYGRSGSSLLSGHSLPFQQQQQSLVGASLGVGGVGPSLDSPNTRPVTAERDIIDDIFGSMPPANSGGGGGATDWGSSGLSGWATGGFGGDASREGSGGLAGDLSSMLQQPMNGGGLGLCGDFLDEQEGEKRQQQQPWNT